MQLGVDIVRIERIARIFEQYNSRFTSRIYTRRELNYCLTRKNVAECLAGRFAAKEALFKAISDVYSEYLPIKAIEVLANTNGKPYYCLPTHVAEQFGCTLSISHERDYAVAVCALERRRR